MFVPNLLPGALVWRDDVHLGVVDHYGVVVQNFPFYVAHIDKGRTGHLRVKVESLKGFAAGRPVNYELVEQPIPLEPMWTRVNAVAKAKKPFGLLAWGDTWNCETFARYVKSGLPHSEQAAKFTTLLVGAAAVWAFVALARSA